MAQAQILVVEDETIVAKDIERCLQGLGYAVPAIASSGEHAIERAAAIHPDLVLMDITLKGRVDGISAAHEIGGRLGIPVVYLTSHADDGTLRRAKVTEPFGYIVKPFDKKDLYTAIELALHRHRAQRTLRSQALGDELTGLYNRRGFLTLATQHLKFARRTKRGCWLIFVDVDGLKQINDTFGHPEGDRALIATAEILTRTFRDSDIVGRLGGDEFTVLAVHADDESASAITKRLAETLDRYNAQEDRGYALAFSVGVARFDPMSPASIEELFARADEALYAQKRNRATS
jgi:diguanylate cyclase (GGDEF)-like protein